jgi:hypothetical protein
VAAVLGLLAGCRGEAPDPTGERTLARLVDSLTPVVERAVGLTFKSPPRHALRTDAEVREFVRRKLSQDLPPERFAQISTAYTMLGLLPDSLDLRGLMEDLLTQQIAGYYDPDSATLYGRAGARGPVLTLTIAHEMVHALQDQYLPLDSILRDKSNADRSVAAQAILEGQANFASIVMLQGEETAYSPVFWETFRQQGSETLASGDLARVPAVLREGILFPYLGGAEFLRWWGRSRFRDTLPYGSLMPSSTEQILFPERYQSGDRPIEIAFSDEVAGAYEDVLGEFDVRLLVQELTGRSAMENAVPLGWGGDRFRLDAGRSGTGLVWVAVWDEPRYRDGFLRVMSAPLRGRAAKGYRVALDTLSVDGVAALRYAIGDSGWAGWDRLPHARVK